MKLSVVSTLYKSAPHIEEFYSRISESIKKVTEDYEIIFVNDGSPDNSLEVALAIQERNNRVKIIDFSKNFGHHKAKMLGLSYASGDYVFLIDCDLEEPPELFNEFWHELLSEDLDMVYGVQKVRKGGLFEKISGYLYYRFINALTNNMVPTNFLTVRLMTKKFVKNLVSFREHELTFSIIIALNGFKSKAIYVTKGHKGSSSYDLVRKINLLVNTVTSSTAIPLWLVFYFGLVITFFASIAIIYLITAKIFYDIKIAGWVSIMVLNLFFGGITIFVLGIIGIYLSKIFIEVKPRPYAIIRDTYGDFNLDTDVSQPLSSKCETESKSLPK